MQGCSQNVGPLESHSTLQPAGRRSTPCVAPRGAAHAFMVTTESARMLCRQTPGSGEAFYRGASEPAGGQDGPVDFERIHASVARNGGIEILGPPPFERHE